MATPADRERYRNDPQRVQARAHLKRGARRARTPQWTPQWVRDCECRIETLPLFELDQTTTDDHQGTSEPASDPEREVTT